MVARRSRRSSSHRNRAASASSSTARRRCRPTATARGRGPSFRPRASPSEWAGSVETTSTRRPERARPTAAAAEQVVLPTPPFPPKKRKRGDAAAGSAPPAAVRPARFVLVLLAREGGLDPRDPHLARRRGGRGVARAHLADAGEQVALELREFLLRDLPQLQPHLRRQ